MTELKKGDIVKILVNDKEVAKWQNPYPDVTLISIHFDKNVVVWL